jgi:xanthine dehydrogenase YagT iron-sulfur-binding subunit
MNPFNSEAMSKTATSKRPTDTPSESTVGISLRVNNEKRVLQIDPRTTLLDALREHLGLTGSKKACDQGQCGACTVHVNGRRILACLSLAIAHQSDEIRTIEGLSDGETLHPMQAAFLECDGFQCGYCTPGQIMSAVAMLHEAEGRVPSHCTPDVSNPPSADELSLEEIRERMSGNICRCGAYPNIVEAIRQARTWTAKREGR